MDRTTASLNILNVSSQPIYGVTILCEGQETRILPFFERDVIPPAKEPYRDTKTVDLVYRVIEGKSVSMLPRVSMTFTDAHGSKWERGFDGTLKRVKAQRQV